jgi:hypothetical protein
VALTPGCFYHKRPAKQKVFFMEEDPAYLTDDGYRFFRPRQESFYLVR